MWNAECHRTLAPEQFGSRKNHRSIDLAVNKVLTNDFLHHTKSPGVICADDTKSCYNLIIHPSAILAMRRQEVPKAAMTCLFNTLQEAKHQVCTAFGDLDTHFGGNDIIPMHRVCQGNGSRPPVWAVISTPILDMLRSANLGSLIHTAITKTSIRFSGFSFVDDTDTIQTARNPYETWREVIQGLKQSLNHWEGGLRATGGAIVPEKTAWNLTSFKWSKGNWSYQPISDTPATLQVSDIQGNKQVLKRLEFSTAMTTLGVEIAPDGNMKQQLDVLLKKSTL